MKENTEKKININKGQFIYNIASGVAIITLFVLFIFKFHAGGDFDKGVRNNGSVNIAYINSDSVMNAYIMVDTLLVELQRLNDSLDKDITLREQTFQARVMAYQQNIQNGTITTVDQAKQQEAALQAEQESLMNLRDLYMNEIAIQQNDMNMRIIDSISIVIERNPEEFPYDFVLGYTKGAGILYASDQFDITDQVVEILNETYSE